MTRPLRTVRLIVFIAIFLVGGAAFTLLAQGQRARSYGPAAGLSVILGRPTDRSIAVSVLSASDIEARIEYGAKPGAYTEKTDVRSSKARVPFELELHSLAPNARYYYRLLTRAPGQGDFRPESEATFETARASGSLFTFAVQGDSHPERQGKMYEPDLYAVTMKNVAKEQPDFYVTMGDDFSIENLISRQALSQPAVDDVYALQRSFLGLVGRSAPLFLVNGNHEEAARYLLDNSPTNPARLAALARTRFFPLPAPGAFYTGDAEPVAGVGLLRDYYAWTWGDALFVVVDCYWHSPVQVDAAAGGQGGGGGGKQGGGGGGQKGRGAAGKQGGGGGGGGGRQRDWWGITIGDEQYHWLQKTLEESRATYKFVFAHHVLGTGRGAIEDAGLYEWGGKDQQGRSQFAARRPGWELPIHQLMVKTGVAIFFQGHDHLYARQQLDGITYQEVPNPADATFTAFNSDAYKSGDILPNSGHLRVTVSPENVRVDYVRSYRPADEGKGQANGAVAHSYTIPARRAGGAK